LNRHCGWQAALMGACAIGVAPSPAVADVFAEDTPLEVKLSAPFGAVFRDRADPEYQPATFVYRSAAGDEVNVPLRVRVRGKSRAVACSFPPLLLNFKTGDLVGTVLEGEDRLKLVTHCQSSTAYDNHLRLEYLTYRALNLLTPTSLRARLVTMSYVDSARERDLGTRPGILLEDEERFAERKELLIHEAPSVERARYLPEALALVDVFQYFIGNTDWSALEGPDGEACCHNVVPYLVADGTPDDPNDNKMIPVLYDFDASGIVDPPHAAPDERLPIRDVRQRLYRGRCRTPEEMAPVFELFRQKRADITALFTEAQGLDARSAQRTREYIDEFYAVLDDDKRRDDAFFGSCRR
jgi:hypothetical protein